MISANRLPATFLNMRLGTSVARLGSPVPRYKSRKPSLSKSPKLLPMVAKTMSRPGFRGHVLEALAPGVAEQAGWRSRLCGWPIRPLTTSSSVRS